MPKRQHATPATELEALLSPGASPPGEDGLAPVVELPAMPPVDRAPVTPPAREAADDVSADALLRWFLPLRKLPVARADGYGGKDLLVPYTVLLVAAVLARGSDTRTVHVDLVAQSFPLGVAHACMRTLAALGFVRSDPTSGLVTILKTPAEI